MKNLKIGQNKFFLFIKSFFNYKFTFLVLLTIIILFVFVFNLQLPDMGNQTAQIISVETKLLKKWQENGGLKGSLAFDSVGSNIILLQKMLSQDSKIYPEAKITGYYGDLTKQAVFNFQKEYNLPKTGIINLATLEKLNTVFFLHLCPQPKILSIELMMRRVGKDFPLPNGYVPPLLENITSKVRTQSIICLRSDVTPFLISMFVDAKKEGVDFMTTSGFRNPKIQKYIYDFWTVNTGAKPLDSIAYPGTSEHQLGTTVDLTDDSVGFISAALKFERGRGFKWLSENAYKYGFSMSFQKGKEKITGFEYEPWHWRFVGVGLATFLYENDLVFNELNFDSNGFILNI